MTDYVKEKAAARILIVEDESILAEDLGLSLENLGYLVRGKVSSGKEAVKLAEALRPDLILMDIKLQGDIDGIEAADQIRTRLDIPVVYLTGYGEKDVLDRAKRTQPYGYLGKPCTFQELRSTIETALYKHKADKRVRESEERLQSILDSLHDFVFVIDEDGIFRDYHQPVDLQKLYVPPGAFLGRHYKEVLPQDVSRLLESAIKSVVRQTASVQLFDYQMEIAGRDEWFSAKVSKRMNKFGGFDGVTVVCRDITERKKTEEELRKSEKQLSKVIESISDGFFALDGNLVVTYFNKAAEALLGRKREDVIHRQLFEAFPEAKGSIFEKNYTKALREQTHLVFETYFGIKPYENWYEVRAYPFEGGISVYFQVTTDRKRAEEALRESEERLQTIFEISPAGIILVNAEGRITFANRKTGDLFSRPCEDLLGTPYVDLVHPEQRSIGHGMMRSLMEGEIDHVSLERRYQAADGREFLGHLSGRRILMEDGTLEGLVGFIADITDRKKAREELRKSNRALMALGNCSEALASIVDESQLLNEICRVVVEVAGYRLAWVGYVESDDLRTVRPVAQSGYNEGYLDKLNITSANVEQGRGPVGTAIRIGMPSLVRNTCADPGFEPWKADALKRGYASCIALPLMAHGEAFGAITIYAPEQDAFDDEETRFLERLADNLSFGIQALREREKNKEAEAQIKASLIEKEVLLREIHHRVKNNLAVMQSMLRLQSRYARSTEFSRMLEDAQNRIMSMALAHELLYQSENLSDVNVGQYVGKLVHHLVASLSEVGGRVKITNEIQNVNLGIDIAVPLGFILTELISNCLKHAFPEERCGEISVSLQTVGDKEFELRVHDDGVGMAADIDTEHPSGMGLDLVKIFVSQLSGTMEILREKGTDVRIRFRER